MLRFIGRSCPDGFFHTRGSRFHSYASRINGTGRFDDIGMYLAILLDGLILGPYTSKNLWGSKRQYAQVWSEGHSSVAELEALPNSQTMNIHFAILYTNTED